VTGRGTALLVAVLLGLVGYLWVDERRRSRRAVASVEAAPLLASTGGVSRVEIDDVRGRLTAMRRGSGWTDAAGRPWAGNAVADLIDTLASLRPVMVVDAAPDDPTAYGLGATAQRLHVAGGDGRALLALEIGERNPAWTGIYVRRSGQREVVLVGAVLRWELEKLRQAAPEG
jgi:hypothetical protein